LNKDFDLLKRIRSERVNIIENKWEIEKPIIFDTQNKNKNAEDVVSYYLVSNYNLNKLQSLYKNLDTISFLDIVLFLLFQKLGKMLKQIFLHIQ